MDVAVKTLDGRSLRLPARLADPVRAVKAEIEARLGGCFKLLARGSELADSDTLESLALAPHDFLVALPVRRKRRAAQQTARAPEVPQAPAAATAASEPGAPQQPAPAASGPCATPLCSPRAQMLSPARAAQAGSYTLLPGYVSRPNPSPHKRARTSGSLQLPPPAPAPAAQAGGADDMWRQLAQELAQAQQQQQQQQQAQSSASPDQGTQQAGEAAEEPQAAAAEAVRAQAVAAGRAGRARRRPAPRAILPGGQDWRLTPQGRLTPAQAAAVAALPLPPPLVRLERVFGTVAAVCCFLHRRNVRATWGALREAVRAFPGCGDACVTDLAHCAQLCPEVVFLEDRAQADGPRSIQEFNATLAAWGPGQAAAAAARPLAEQRQAALAVELADGSRHAVAAIAAAMGRPPPPPAGLPRELANDAGAKGSGGGEVGVEEQLAAVRGAVGLTQRRRGAFRRAAVRAVLLLHARHVAALAREQALQLGPGSGAAERPEGGGRRRAAAARRPPEWDPLQEGAWHPGFPLAQLSLAGVLEAAVQSGAELAEAERQGRVRPEWEDAVSGVPAAAPRMTRRHEPCRDCTRLGVAAFLEHLQALPWYAGQVSHTEDVPARRGAYQRTAAALSGASLAALRARGIGRLFTHQAQAVDAALAGRHVVVCTPTASGKSLCYNLPVLEALAADAAATAIYIFPTKALAQDQLRAIREAAAAAFPHNPPPADVYDGDTPQEERGEMRARARLLVTNPDMLHQSVLPVHRQFARLLAGLRYVVVDEGHAYRGVFGCHTALVLRRLRRVCEREYGRSPTFVVTSATIANPREHVQALLGVQDVAVVSRDGSPHGPQRFVLWNPPLTAPNHALAAANGLQRSRTEGRARKGERRRALRQAVAGGEQPDVPPAAEAGGEAGASLAFSAARLHRRRHADGLALPPRQPADKELEEGSLEEQQMLEGLLAASCSSAELHAAAAAELLPACVSGCCAADSAPEPALAEAASEAASQPEDGGGKRLRGRQQLSVDQVRARMAGSPGEAAPAARRAAAASGADALAAVAETVTLTGERPTHPARQIAYRDDEPGSGRRQLLRRRLHGQRFGQKPGMAHPAGQFAHAAGGGGGNDVNSRMPARGEWRDKFGAAGVSLDRRRRSPIVEIAALLAEAVQHGVRTIAFCKTRKLCELVITYAREMLRASAPHLCHAISVYRAGYSPAERREIERALFSGTLHAVAATNALELGLDVGCLDMTMHLGFQGSVASFRQQAGRAGRREQQSMSIYVAFDGPMDQYFMAFPRQLFDRPIEAAHIDPSNRIILEQHAVCAAAELPLVLADDTRFFGPALHTTADALVADGLLSRHPLATHTHALHYTGAADCPAARFSLRAIDPERYQIVNEAAGGAVMEEVEESKAFFQVYDGAVYMFQGRTYLCKKLDLAARTATVRPADVKYYTSIRDHTDIHVVGGAAAYPSPEALLRAVGGAGAGEATMAQCQEAEVTTRWLGFHRVRHGTGEIFDTVDLFLPDVQFPTQAAYLRVPQAAKAALAEAGLPYREGLHAAMHAILNVVPLHMMCGAGDLGAECDNPYSARFRPDRLLLFDRHPGGIGLAFKVCDMFGVLMRKAVALIEACPCTGAAGCPGCVQHTDCNQYNAVLDKRAGAVVLRAVLRAQADFRAQLALRLAEAAPGGAVPDAGAVMQAVRTRLAP